jgi:uncharacterized protein YdaU (DUF1376 family)
MDLEQAYRIFKSLRETNIGKEASYKATLAVYANKTGNSKNDADITLRTFFDSKPDFNGGRRIRRSRSHRRSRRSRRSRRR